MNKFKFLSLVFILLSFTSFADTNNKLIEEEQDSSCNLSITNVLLTNPTDCGVQDGTIIIMATGGSNLEYKITKGHWQSSNVFTGLKGRRYTVRVREANNTGCKVKTKVTLVSPVALVINSIATTNPTDSSSMDGTITITATGAAVPIPIGIEYSIDNGTTWQLSNTFTGLISGTYFPTVRNSNAILLDVGSGTFIAIKSKIIAGLAIDVLVPANEEGGFMLSAKVGYRF